MKLTPTQQNAVNDIRTKGGLERKSPFWPWQHSTGSYAKFGDPTVRALVRLGYLRRGLREGNDTCELIEPANHPA